MSKGRRFIFTTLLFLIIFSFSLNGETGVLLSTESSDAEALNSLKYIINNTISLELQVAGYSVLRTEVLSDETLQARAEKQRASFIIENIYSTADGVLDVEVNCYRVEGNEKIYSSSEIIELDLNLDISVKAVAVEMVKAINSDISAHPEKVVEIEPETAEERDEKTVLIEEPETSEIKEEESVTVLPETVSYRPDKILKPLSISAGFSPFLAVGAVSDYFKIAYVPDISASYRLGTSFGYWSIGLFASLNYFEATGLLVSSENLLISLGPELKLGVDINSLMSLFVKLNGGVSLYMINRNNEGYENTFVPVFSGGLGLSFDIVPSFSISIAADFAFYIESSILISGFMPAIGVHFNL